MKIKKTFAIIMLVAATSVCSIWGYDHYQENELAFTNPADNNLFKTAAYTGSISADPVDFEKAAAKAVPAIMHIRTTQKANK